MKEKRRNDKSKRRDEEEEGYPGRRVSSEVLRGVSAVFFIAIGVFLVLAGAGLGGVAGSTIYEWLSWLLGLGYMLLPLSLVLLAIAILRSFEKHFGLIQLGSMAVFLLAAVISSLREWIRRISKRDEASEEVPVVGLSGEENVSEIASAK